MRPDAIIKTLEDAGFEARYVGGCVRDTLLDRPIHDWDIASQALPEDVLRLFPHCVPTGIRHGTVTVLLDGVSAEVTTYRLDGAYHDGRHPEGVCFVRSLAEDLARRDFTINAMAMDESGAVTDLFGGREDLSRRVIRCVGEPETRFREDALRMLRAYRFAAQLGFSLDAQTQAAIERGGLSMEQAEWLKGVQPQARRLEAAEIIAQRGLTIEQARRLFDRPEETQACGKRRAVRRAAEEAQRLSDALNAQGIPACASMHAQGQGLCIQILLKNERLS